MALKDLSKNELLARVNRMSTSMKRVREKSSEVTEHIVDASLTMGGGVMSGLLRGWNEDGSPVEVPGTDIPADAVIAAGFLVLGISGMGGQASHSILSLGAGMGASAAGFHTAEMVRRARKDE